MAFYCRRFLFRMLLYFLLDTLSHAVGNPTHQVKGILGGSVLFPANVSQGRTVEKIQWDFRPQRRSLGFRLGEFSHGKLEHQSPTDQFRQRLDMVGKTTLRIKDLELNDSGIYNARIWFMKSQFQEQSFSLTVYEPVPTPQIDHQVESKTPGGCNVILRCHTPEREDLSISWETGDPHRALGMSVNQYQVSDNGRELRVSFWNSSLDSEFTCLASNPVDQKRASFDLLNICQSDEGVGSLMEKKGESTLTLQNAKMIDNDNDDDDDDDDDDEVDSNREELTTSSTPPRESFPSPNSSPVSDTEPSEIEHCMRGQAHLLEPLLRNSLRVSLLKDPLKISHRCQLSRSYSQPSSLQHWPQRSCDHDREQHTKTYPVTMEGVSSSARNLRNGFITSSSI